MSLLEIENLVVHYGSALVLDRVALEVSENECVGVIGPNGAGKTTLLRAISGIKDWQGRISFRGKSLAGISCSKVVAMGIVQAPEGRHLFPQLTVQENLELGGFQLKSKSEKADNYHSVLELFPRLAERSKQMAGTLSGGEQQMLTICRTLMGDPDLIMIDEPTEGLAPQNVERVRQLIEEIAARGVAILLVEQKLTIALQISARIYVMGHGRIVFEGKPEDLRDNADIRKEWLEV